MWFAELWRACVNMQNDGLKPILRLLDALNHEPLEIVVNYKSKLSLDLWGKRISNKFLVDVASFEGVSISEPALHKDLKTSLEEIAKSIKSLK